MVKSDRKSLRIGLTLLLLALLGALMWLATWAAFSDTTEDEGNHYDAGSVDIEDNDPGSTALYDLFDGTPYAKPGNSDSGCIKVTYNGSLASTVRLYASYSDPARVDNPLDDQLTLAITTGTGAATNQDCTGTEFTAAGATGDAYSGSLANFMATYPDWDAGLSLNAGGDATWSQTETVTYQFEVTLEDDADVNDANSKTTTGYDTGDHVFTWEARNS